MKIIKIALQDMNSMGNPVKVQTDPNKVSDPNIELDNLLKQKNTLNEVVTLLNTAMNELYQPAFDDLKNNTISVNTILTSLGDSFAIASVIKPLITDANRVDQIQTQARTAILEAVRNNQNFIFISNEIDGLSTVEQLLDPGAVGRAENDINLKIQALQKANAGI